MRKLFRNKKGIVGIEAAIVLIAFVIIAAALSYVVINMGFYITQKTKETMQGGLDESLNALQLDGLITGRTNENSSLLEYLIIPVKISASGAAVDLSSNSVVISVYLKNATLFNVHRGAVVANNCTTWEDLISALDLGENEAKFAIYNGNNNTVLESTEKAFLVIRLGPENMASGNEIIKIEVRIAKGAALTVARTVPPGLLPNSFVSLG
jgi:flagellin FlaB